MNPVLRLDHRYHDVEDHDRGLVFDLATLDRRRMLKLLGLGGISAGPVHDRRLQPVGIERDRAPARRRPQPPGASGRRRAGSADALVRGHPRGDRRARSPATARTAPTSCPRPASSARTSGRASARRRPSPRASRSRSASPLQDGADCAPLAGAAVYVWHCDRDGNYSLYSQAAANENYLRGVQAAGDDGVVTFDSIFPASYQGRWPHIHFEVYPSLETATDEANKIATSQIALPKDVCDTVYATAGLRAERPEHAASSASRPTWSSATTAASTSSGR